jgi:hypothetical protein
MTRMPEMGLEPRVRAGRLRRSRGASACLFAGTMGAVIAVAPGTVARAGSHLEASAPKSSAVATDSTPLAVSTAHNHWMDPPRDLSLASAIRRSETRDLRTQFAGSAWRRPDAAFAGNVIIFARCRLPGGVTDQQLDDYLECRMTAALNRVQGSRDVTADKRGPADGGVGRAGVPGGG